MIYKTAIYVRLSREDGDKAVSDSIINQQKMINSYIEQKNKDDIQFEIVDTYSDDNWTGTNFNRPAFERMYNDILEKKVNCVIVKDLSRFGRDYIDVGRFLQKEFPKLNVRFIAINDNVDSLAGQYDMLMPVKNIFNENYARDISQKVISSIRTKQNEGKFIGAFACYGYLKSPTNKNKLEIDSYASEVVKRIFKLFIAGKGKLSIAKILNSENILCPSEYKKSLGLNYYNGTKLLGTAYWTYSTINKILQNEMYTGTMVQHKSDCSRYSMTNTRDVNSLDWIKKSDTHEPIIDIESWNLAQNLLKRNTKSLDFTQNVSKYAGFLFCADCGRAMTKVKWGENIRYICGSFKRYSKNVCTNHAIAEKVLDEIIINDINSIIVQIIDFVEIIHKSISDNSQKKVHNKTLIEKSKIQLDKIKRLKKGLYDDYKDGIISLVEYNDYKNDYLSQEKILTEIIGKAESQDESEKNLLDNEFIKNLLKYKKVTQVDRILLESFFDKIIIHENKQVELHYKFGNVENLMENVQC